jgi:hypothetical protein
MGDFRTQAGHLPPDAREAGYRVWPEAQAWNASTS